MFPAGLEQVTFRVLGVRDNHYTTETTETSYSHIGKRSDVVKILTDRQTDRQTDRLTD